MAFSFCYRQYTFFDPSIVEQTTESDASEQPKATTNQSQPVFLIITFLLQEKAKPQRQHSGEKTKKVWKNVSFLSFSDQNNSTEEAEEPVRNDFDFEESNKKFEKEGENVSAAAAYKKTDFFDNLQQQDKLF